MKRRDLIAELERARMHATSQRRGALILDSRGLRLAICNNSVETWSTSFQNFSGAWAAATFSPCGDYIVLGCPDDFDFRVWRRC